MEETQGEEKAKWARQRGGWGMEEGERTAMDQDKNVWVRGKMCPILATVSDGLSITIIVFSRKGQLK